jgi:hypothetical protein
MNDMIVKYVKNRQGHPVGCVIAKRVDANDNVYITGSLCRRGKDKFDKDQAVELALDRVNIMATYKRPCPVAISLKMEIDIMCDRAKRYFKDAKGFVSSAIHKPKQAPVHSK